MITRTLVATVRWLLIVLAYACLPIYGLWILGGAMCDRMERRRRG